MKKVRSSQAAILVLNWVKHSFSLWVFLSRRQLFISFSFVPFVLEWFQAVRGFMLLAILFAFIAFAQGVYLVASMPVLKSKHQPQSVSLGFPTIFMFLAGKIHDWFSNKSQTKPKYRNGLVLGKKFNWSSPRVNTWSLTIWYWFVRFIFHTKYLWYCQILGRQYTLRNWENP